MLGCGFLHRWVLVFTVLRSLGQVFFFFNTVNSHKCQIWSLWKDSTQESVRTNCWIRDQKCRVRISVKYGKNDPPPDSLLMRLLNPSSFSLVLLNNTESSNCRAGFFYFPKQRSDQRDAAVAQGWWCLKYCTQKVKQPLERKSRAEFWAILKVVSSREAIWALTASDSLIAQSCRL